jgi:O-antigen/teichoic acid export membrane protein
MKEPLAEKALCAVRWTSLNMTCQVGVQFLSLFILGRLLSPRAFGLMAMIMVIIEIVNVFARMGLSEAIIYKKDISRDEISSLYFLNIAVGGILFVVIFCLSESISRLYSEPDLTPLIQVLSPVFLVSAFGVIFEILLRKNLSFETVAKVNVFSHVSSFLCMIVLALWGAGVYSLVFGQLLFHLARSIFLFRVAAKERWLPRMHFSFSEIVFYLKFGLYRVLAMSANQINSRVDQLLIGSMLGSVALGFYNVAFRIIYLPVNQVNPTLTQVAFPFFSKIQDDIPRLKRNYIRYINLIMSINAPVLAGITALSPVLVPLLMGDKWLPSVPIVQALAFYVFMRAIFNATGSLMMAKGKASWTFYWCISMLFIIPVTTYSALKLTGSVVGVCFALGAIFFVFFFVHYFLFVRRLLGSFLFEYLKTICKPLLLSSIMGIFTYMLTFLLHNVPKAISAPVLIGFGIIFYFVLTIIFNPSFVNEMQKVLPKWMEKYFDCMRGIIRISRLKRMT